MRIIERIGVEALHRMEPERAHDLSIAALSRGLVPMPGAPVSSPRLRTRLAGMDLPNPVGLAAGYDKNGRACAALMRAGFGFIECGAATPRPQTGNDKPRLFRLSGSEAIINRFGFNNEGAAVIAQRLAARPAGVPVGLNIGANRDSEDRAADFAEVVRVAGETADFLTVNVSSPNTERLRELQGAEALAALLKGVMAARDSLPVRRPVFLKIAPDLDENALADLANVAKSVGVDAIIATNTTLSRDGVTDPQSAQPGGMSGRPLFARSTRVLAQIYRMTGGHVPLIGVGGINSVEDAWQKIRAGASAVQLYTALIYHGFSRAAEIARGLDQRAEREGLASLSELTGTGAEEWARAR
ncbi:quinone-dependent dihydroorotate dehydrogenase [Paracoccus sediminicola]|uniref:quinone-dependent dihydroorotate dehydrogenase n=1 Tax=Paracoccus sediminicola TaxID=3017783 RepID=UPI0022F03CA2|nr:quinone-dependent dihydroorotate dehydrogenase [Paracoccus sediminicola]WBU57991.1 quinone-dependent dihydroorotate dehydrogenase [Paracoccus sediminicola]